jgi:hypothetical protein
MTACLTQDPKRILCPVSGERGVRVAAEVQAGPARRSLRQVFPRPLLRDVLDPWLKVVALDVRVASLSGG